MKITSKKTLTIAVISIVVCLTLIVGGTLAWFTDAANLIGNNVGAGTLKISTYYADYDNAKSGDWTAFEENSDPIFGDIEWEPGYMALKFIKIENTGSLAFEWTLDVVRSANQSASILPNAIDVYCKTYSESELSTLQLTKSDVLAYQNKTALADVLSSNTGVISGGLIASNSSVVPAASKLEAKGSVVVCVALYMQEEAGNEYKKVTDMFDIVVNAKQYASESDAFGKDYDASVDEPDYSDYGVPSSPVKEEVVLHYDMTNYGTTLLLDMSGYGNHGKMHSISEDDFYTNGDDKILKLTGSDGSYIDIPLSAVDNLDWEDGFTVEMTFIPKTAQNQFLWTLGTGNQTNYIRINSASIGAGNFQATFKTDGTDLEWWIGSEKKLSSTDFSVATVTYDPNSDTLIAYINGETTGYVEVGDQNLSSVFAGNGNDILGYIAKSNWSDPYADATVTDFKIYNRTLDADDIVDNYAIFTAQQALRVELANVTIPEYSYDAITLYSSDVYEIDWTSSVGSLLSENTLSCTDADTAVTLTAVLTDPNTRASVTVSYDVLMVAAGDAGRVNFVANYFDLGVTHTTEDIALLSSFDGVTITWTGDDTIASNGKIRRGSTNRKSTLRATFTYNGESTEKEYSVTVIGKSNYTLCTYIAYYEPNMGSEFAEYPSGHYVDNARTDVMYYAVSEDGVNYTGLNNDKPVLYPETGSPNYGVPFEYQLGSPNVFRKADGTYGAIASNNNAKNYVLVWNSTDLISFTNQHELILNNSGIAVMNPTVKYDNATKLYGIYWEGGDGNSYVSYTADFKTVTKTEQTTYTKSAFSGNLPVYADSTQATVFELSADEYNAIMRKYGEIKSIAISDIPTVEVSYGEEVTLPEYVTVEYNDGSTKNMAVEWDTSGIDLSNLAKGTYTVNGTVKNNSFSSTEPLAYYRADPQVNYIEKDGKYYFTSSYMQGDLENAYRYVILRSADTIEGLSDAEHCEEVIVWSEYREGDCKPWYWAPEIHYFDNKYNIICLSTYTGTDSLEGWRMTILSCDGSDDPMDPDNWYLRGLVNPDSSDKYPGAFDTTFFKYNGQCYYVSPVDAGIWIATFDEDDPLNFTSNLVKISTSSYAWEYNVGSNHQYVEEASYVIIRDGKIYITYAGSTVDMHYCIGLLYADLDDDLLDPESWHKYPLPILTTQDLTTTITEPTFNADGTLNTEGEYQGTFGPGHNSITYDELGNAICIYHARRWQDNYVGEGAKYGLGDPGRHAFATNVHFGYDGIPIMNMTDEQQLADSLKSVSVTVTVK